MTHFQPPEQLENPPAAGELDVLAQLDRYDIAVSLTAVYEWGGYRYSNPNDAIAAAKRGSMVTGAA